MKREERRPSTSTLRAPAAGSGAGELRRGIGCHPTLFVSTRLVTVSFRFVSLWFSPPAAHALTDLVHSLLGVIGKYGFLVILVNLVQVLDRFSLVGLFEVVNFLGMLLGPFN